MNQPSDQTFPRIPGVNSLKVHPVILITIISSLVLLGCSILRHELFQSNAFDLGIFDNGVYLISQGQKPFVAFRGIHIFGDHAAWILYPIALLYKIYPSVYWLLGIQAVALAGGAIPTWLLALKAGLKPDLAGAIAGIYLLYPLVFNVNLFDFHPEVIALPLLLGAVLMARLNQIPGFTVAIVLILGCKAVLALTVMALGFWLLWCENKRKAGIIAITSGLAWFLIATFVIIPHFSGAAPPAIGRYDILGNSVGEIITNLVLKPEIVLQQLFTLPNLEYVVLLIIPVIWGLSPRHFAPLIGAIPTLVLNLLSDSQQQKNLTQQYGLPILPFLLLGVISTLAAGRGWLRSPRKMIVWSLIAFLALAKYGYFWSRYLKHIDTVSATRAAISLVSTQGSVLTADQITSHLTHRSIVMLATLDTELQNLSQFKYILLNRSYPGWGSSPEFVSELIQELKSVPQFELLYQRDGVFLFVQQSRKGLGKSDLNMK
ncbi:MAG: DUF2079 domain-containing protein [Oscillatoriales cyanobacterium RM2_1_1]|nr:DUF2079 domain-containing protein [Oscillatoriales cyanobacterium SM2_3_0]NJO47377.1 DUF2079 domain-containing protein [Oscillatoriales cyanobacterium RM2_1_1]